MAFESYFWRKSLNRDISYLEKKLRLSHKEIEKNIDKHFSTLEIKIMEISYAVRKLADTYKIPDGLLDEKIKMNFYPRSTNQKRAFVDIEKEYNLKKTLGAELKIREVCNQIIHSYIFQSTGNSRRAFTHILFVSDRDQDEGLYSLDLKSFLKKVSKIVNTQVTKISAEYDKKKGVWKYSRK